jgi:tetratricopeptide (TPR) repeat protein
MESARARVLEDFPYLVAYPYSLIFGERDKPSMRRWALCFTEYQLLRIVCLPLVSQYLEAETVDRSDVKSIEAINRAIAAIRSPFFSDWITLLHTLHKHLSRIGIEPLFPQLRAALHSFKPEERAIGLRGQKHLEPLSAILALRNETAHGGLPDESEAMQHLDSYLPILHQVLDAFDFLGDTALKVLCDTSVETAGVERVRTLSGAALSVPIQEEITANLAAAFTQSAAVLTTAERKTVPLYPLFNPVTDKEPLYLYDGHYAIRIETKHGVEELSYIYYLGTHHRVSDSGACDKLKDLLAKRKLFFFLEKEQTAPWTIADSAADYSRRTFEGLLHIRYFPECYLPFSDLERDWQAFIRVPEAKSWSNETFRPRYINGFILIGLAGSGKTAFLAHQVEQLLMQVQESEGRENPNLLLFLRGDGIALRSEGMSLFRDVAEKLGIAVEGSSTRTRSHGGFSSFRELLDHLHQRWKQDRIEDRRLVLLLDALNEAPYAERVMREALEMVKEAACFPWCKIIISTRQEWLHLWSGKMGAQESSPLEQLRPWLYVPAQQGQKTGEPTGLRGDEGPPVVTIEPFTEEQAAEVYRRYQAHLIKGDGGSDHIPTCLTSWCHLAMETKQLLSNPLYLHLFMETFDRRVAESVITVPALFRRYVSGALQHSGGLQGSVEPVINHLLKELHRPGANLNDDDVNTIRRFWAEGRSIEEARLELSPVEALAHEGWITKRVREEGGGYRFVFQAVAEYLLYLQLKQQQGTEEELAYWARRAKPEVVFPEYAGAFAFLLRDWAAEERLPQAARLVEQSAPWLADVLSAFLIEQARIGYVPGLGSNVAEVAGQSLIQFGSQHCSTALHSAAYALTETRFARAALVYFQADAHITEALWQANPSNVQIGTELGNVLSNLGVLLYTTGNVEEAETAFHRAMEISEAVWQANPDNVEIGDELGTALSNLGVLLKRTGKVKDAEKAYRRAAQISEALCQDNPDNEEVGNSFARALTNLGALLVNCGNATEAEKAFRDALVILEKLWQADPNNIDVQSGLASVLTNLASLLCDGGKVMEAEKVYRRALRIWEDLWQANPDNLTVGNDLAGVLNNLGGLLRDGGNVTEAKKAYHRALRIWEELWQANPDNSDVGNGLAGVLNDLGGLLRDGGQVTEAENAYQQALMIREELCVANPDNLEVKHSLATLLNNIGLLLRANDKVEEAEEAYRRSLQIYEALWQAIPDDVMVAHGHAMVLINLGVLLRVINNDVQAEQAYRHALEISETLWQANPGNVVIGNGLVKAFFNLGNLLRSGGKVAEAETAYHHSLQISEALWQANPDNVEIKLMYAASLLSVKESAKAELLVNEVLVLIPNHPYGNELKRISNSISPTDTV